MECFIIIHQKEGRDLYDYYRTEDAAKAAIQAISDTVHVGMRSVVTPSGKVTFEVANYAGAEYKTQAPTSKATNRGENDRSKGRLPQPMNADDLECENEEAPDAT